MSDSKVINGSKIKRTTNKKEVEVSCWNCFTAKEFNDDLEAVPLSKIREEQRAKFKLYSFLASELSKPKAVSFKQKVSDHYSVGKKIDRKVHQNNEVAQYLQDNTEVDASINNQHFLNDTSSTATNKSSQIIEGSTYDNHNKLSDTEIKRRKVKLSRSDSSSSSSRSPDFKPKRKQLTESNITRENNRRTIVEKSVKRVSCAKSLGNKNNFSDTKSSHCEIQKFKVISPLLQISRLRQSNTFDGAEQGPENQPDLCKDIPSDFQIPKIPASIPRISKLPIPKAPSQTQQELFNTREKLDDTSMIESISKSSENSTYSPSMIPVATKKWVSVDPKNNSVRQRLRERYSLDNKTMDMKPLASDATNRDTTYSSLSTTWPNKLAKITRPAALKQNLNEHYSINKEVDETIAKYTELTIPKTSGTEDIHETSMSKSELPKGKTVIGDITSTTPQFKEHFVTNIETNTNLVTSVGTEKIAAEIYELGSSKSISNENIEHFNEIGEKIETTTQKNQSKITSIDESNVSDVVGCENENKNGCNFVNKEIDEMIAKCAKLTISDIKGVYVVDKVSIPSDTPNKVIPITESNKLARVKSTQCSLIVPGVQESCLQIISNTKVDRSSRVTGTNITQIEENINNGNTVKEEFGTHVSEDVKSSISENAHKILSRTLKYEAFNINQLKSESLGCIYTKPTEKKGVKNNEELTEKADNASSNGSKLGYAGSLGTVQDVQKSEVINKELKTEVENKNRLTKKKSLDYILKTKDFKSSLPALNKTTEKRILKITTTSKSLSTEINNTGVKSHLKSLRWSTLSVPVKPIRFQDEVYMSDTLSSGNATLPRRSSSPLPHDRDLDRDRFPINRSGLQARSESMASVYSGAGEGARGCVAVRGEVQFSLLYNYRLGALEVGVKRCRDLAPVDTKRNRSDPYVKVYLLPDKSKAGKRKTKVKKNTLNPVFEETLSFVQPLASLSARTLWLSVWHADMFGRNDFLGEVALPLADVVFDDPAPMWYKLHERTEQFDEQQGTRGDLIVGLKFESHDSNPSRGKGTLHVLVKEAKNLVATKPNGLTDVFCKSYLLPERGRLAKQKTTVARRTLNPRWEHTFTYRGLTMQELATRALELSLWDRDRLASNDFMGAIRLSLGTGTYMGASVNWMDSMGKEIALWQTMMQRPNFWVEGSLPLRPQLNN